MSLSNLGFALVGRPHAVDLAAEHRPGGCYFFAMRDTETEKKLKRIPSGELT